MEYNELLKSLVEQKEETLLQAKRIDDAILYFKKNPNSVEVWTKVLDLFKLHGIIERINVGSPHK